MKEKNVTQTFYVPPHFSFRRLDERDVITTSGLDADPTEEPNKFDNVGADKLGTWQ